MILAAPRSQPEFRAFWELHTQTDRWQRDWSDVHIQEREGRERIRIGATGRKKKDRFQIVLGPKSRA